jgi:hypothetical protein
MNAATVETIAREMFDGNDSQQAKMLYRKIAYRMTSFTAESLMRQLLDLKRRKQYLLSLTDKERFEMRLILTELDTRDIAGLDFNEIT